MRQNSESTTTPLALPSQGRKRMSDPGFVSWRAGSGTHVLAPAPSPGRVFGLLIPDLAGLKSSSRSATACSRLYRSPILCFGAFDGGSRSTGERSRATVQRVCSAKVSIFFAPLEFTPAKDAVNNRIVGALYHAGIQIVLLDRRSAPCFSVPKYDLVGIDNRRAGFLITHHLLRHGVKRIAFCLDRCLANRWLSRSIVLEWRKPGAGSCSSRRP